MEISEAERHVLLHSLGGLKAYRNHFCTDSGTDDYPVCSDLVEKGLMSVRKGNDMTGGGYIFHVTEAGKKVALSVDRSQYHTRCHHCGRFVKRERWVPRDHQWKKFAMCGECLAGIEGPWDA